MWALLLLNLEKHTTFGQNHQNWQIDLKRFFKKNSIKAHNKPLAVQTIQFF
jgi:hypothetical protein